MIGIGAFLYGGSFLLAEVAPDAAQTTFSGPAGIGAVIAGVGVAAFILPPLQVAQSFCKHETRAMIGKEGWGLALVCGILLTGVVAGLFYLAALDNPQLMQELMGDGSFDLTVTLIPMAIFAVILILIYRLFFWAGVRGQIKQAAWRANKA